MLGDKSYDLLHEKGGGCDASNQIRSIRSSPPGEHHLDLYRLDYNPLFTFDGPSRFRDGLAENNCWRYYEAFYSMYERIHQRYPDPILQQCAAGGARNDLSTVSRFHETYLTDGLSIPRELRIYSGQTLGLPPTRGALAEGQPANEWNGRRRSGWWRMSKGGKHDP
jgi:alpha-galactosidase